MKLKKEQLFLKYLPILRKWSFSGLCLPFCWFLTHQYWMALKWEISFAWMYDYPFVLSPFFFLMDHFLLIVHEAGHTFFGFLGSDFIAILGGTFFEILLPFLIFAYGWWNRNRITAQLGLLLTAFAWLESSAYAADAVARRMPLIGDLPASAHDFYNLFTKAGMMDYYMTVAWTMYWTGILILIICLIWPLLERKEYEEVKLDIDM